MGADLSRIRMNPLLDFTGVELKQGGVLLDADFNELVAATDRRLRALAGDVLGRSTVSSTTPDAFRITASGGTLSIGKGRLYVDGLLAENHGAVSSTAGKKRFDPLMGEVQYADAILYAAQPYLPAPPVLPSSGKHLVYLDVWQREVTHLERTELVETAVGVETSSRVQAVWQVRVLGEAAGSATCASPDDEIGGWEAVIAPSEGRLTTGTFDAPPEEDPCELPPTGGYTGLENQTYRVEIHDPGQPGADATFKWSRDNASIGTRVSSMVSASELELPTLGRDDVLRFNTGDWVEITDDVREFSQAAGEIRQITVNEAARRISFSAALPAGMLPPTFPNSDHPRSRNLRVRRWDQKHEVLSVGAGGTTSVLQDLDAGTSGVIDVPAAGTTVVLEKGVTVSFTSTGPRGFRAGDYWVFAARTADASVEALSDEPPRGIHHHYERLGIWEVDTGTVTDCRHPWPPPTVEGNDCSCTACVTEQSHASEQFTIQDAVNTVRETGGTVCIGPGRYALRQPVVVSGARSVRIRGHGPATLLAAPGTAFEVQTSFAVAIENLGIVSLGQAPAIAVRTVIGFALRKLAIKVMDTKGTRDAAIALQGIVAAASIRENWISAPLGVIADAANDREGTGFLLAASIAIEDNVLWCAAKAVALDDRVLHMLRLRIAGNEILGCSETAISALGFGAPGSSLDVNRNSINVSGNGIRCGLDGLSIEGNKVANTGGAAASRARTVGIALASGLDRNGPDQCQILANQVSGFSEAGILIGSPARELIVKLNIIERCGNGIQCAGDADSGSISVENNHLRDIGPPGGESVGIVVGIGLVRADSASVAGNTIQNVAVRALQGTLRAGILAMGVQNVRVNGNDVTVIGPPQEFGGLAAGIMLRGPFSTFDVGHNRVHRDTDASAQGGGGSAWTALTTADVDQKDSLSNIAGVGSIPAGPGRVIVLGPSPYLHTTQGAQTTTDTTTGAAAQRNGIRGSVLGNDFSARGSGEAVDISAPAECLFNDNRVELRGAPRTAVVRLNTEAAIVSANRVRAFDGMSILVVAPKSAAVLGNITTGGIGIPGPLQAPWDKLNIRA